MVSIKYSTTRLLVIRARQVITISKFHDRSCVLELSIHVLPSSDHSAQEPGPFYPHPLLSALCTEFVQELRKCSEDRLKL